MIFRRHKKKVYILYKVGNRLFKTKGYIDLKKGVIISKTLGEIAYKEKHLMNLGRKLWCFVDVNNNCTLDIHNIGESWDKMELNTLRFLMGALFGVEDYERKVRMFLFVLVIITLVYGIMFGYMFYMYNSSINNLVSQFNEILSKASEVVRP